MPRRDFLRLIGAGALIPWNAQLAFAAAPAADYRRMLVLVELKGGNDGLNSVIPYADASYYRLRPRLGLAPAPRHRARSGRAAGRSERSASLAQATVATVAGARAGHCAGCWLPETQ